MRCLNFAACAAVLMMVANPASGQTLSRTWVATSGDDGNACTRNAPCRSFDSALSKTGNGGEITCADSGNFNLPRNITQKSITINCEGAVATSADPTGASLGGAWITLNSTDRVTLRGFDIDLAGTSSSGIFVDGAGTLILDRMKISNGGALSGATNGIVMKPYYAGSLRLVVTDSVITNFAPGAGGAGIVINPQQDASAQITLERVTVSGSGYGIVVDGSNSTGGINMTIADSVVAGNIYDGIAAITTSGHAPIGVMIKNTKSTNNGYGIRSTGPNVTVRVDGSTIIGNGTGLAASSGGSLLSLQTNVVHANGNDGAFTGSLALQ